MVVIFRAFTLISTIVPETTTVYFGAELETFDPTEKKIGVYEVGEVTFLLASSLLEILSISSIALTWILGEGDKVIVIISSLISISCGKCEYTKY